MNITEVKISSINNFPLAYTLINALRDNGIIRFNCLNYSIGQSFLNFLSTDIGRPSFDDVTNPNDIRPYIHEVKLISNIVDKHGFVPYSLTNKVLPCHTEDYFNSKPSNIISFYCVRQAKIGGETYLVHIDDIINKLTHQEIEFLSKEIFPMPEGLTRILTFDKSNNKYHIKYSRIIINKIAAKEPNRVTQEMITVFNKIDNLLSEHKFILQLPENSCILIDNTRVLHGRAGFDEKSDRLIFRIKLNSPEL